MKPVVLNLIKDHLSTLDVSGIDAVILLGKSGTGKSTLIESLVDHKNIFSNHISSGDVEFEFKFQNNGSKFVAMDETEYFKLGDVQQFVKASTNSGRTAIISAQTDSVIREKIKIISDLFKSRSSAEDQLIVKVVDLNKAFVSHDPLHELLIDVEIYLPQLNQ